MNLTGTRSQAGGAASLDGEGHEWNFMLLYINSHDRCEAKAMELPLVT